MSQIEDGHVGAQTLLEKIEWSDDYSVGHPLMDQQHQRLVGLVNQMVDCVNVWDDAARFELVRLMTEFYSTSENHFAREEMLLGRVDYPGLHAQRRSHESYAERFSRFIAKGGKSDQYRQEFVELLLNWWRTHILVEDMAYKPYFDQQSSEQ